jgi:hypothetical protein
MTFPLFEAFQAEWRLRPPVHWLAAAFMGYKPPKAADGPKAPGQAKAAAGDRPKGGGGGRSLKRDFPGGVIR